MDGTAGAWESGDCCQAEGRENGKRLTREAKELPAVKKTESTEREVPTKKPLPELFLAFARIALQLTRRKQRVRSKL